MHPLLRWLIPNDSVRLVSRAEWQSEDNWTVRERLEYGSGAVVERRMEARLTATDRVVIKAPDMPEGAEIQLKHDRFVFSPYVIVAEYRGRRARLRCRDSNVMTGPNSLRDTIHMYWGPFPVATMTLDVQIEREEVVAGQ
jgi:hypothetical protein